MSEQGPTRLDLATEMINTGRFADALETAQTVLVGDPQNVSAKLIEAIALSQMGNKRDASEAFAKAVEMDPSSVKAYFNGAVHEYNVGNLPSAQVYLAKALELDPNHEGAKALYDRVGSPPAPVDQTADYSNAYARQPSSSMEVPYAGIPMIENMGKSWTAIGWVLSLISFSFLVIGIVIMIGLYPSVASAIDKGDIAAVQKVANGAVPMWFEIVGLMTRLISIIWMIMDIMHRRASFIWLIAHIPCSCCSIGFIPQTLYLLLGRK